jgi:hypothetical protein
VANTRLIARRKFNELLFLRQIQTTQRTNCSIGQTGVFKDSSGMFAFLLTATISVARLRITTIYHRLSSLLLCAHPAFPAFAFFVVYVPLLF